MNANLEVWAAWADILSLPLAVLSFVLAIIAWIWPGPHPIQILLQRIRPFLPYIFIAALFFWVGTLINKPQEVYSPPPVSLISISYEIGEYDPRRVDLRTASTSGIPVTAGQALRLYDLWFSTTENGSLYMVQAEIYANDHLIGSTSPVPLIAGQTKLENVKIENYNHGSYPTSWNVQPEWKDLQVFLVTYLKGEVANRCLTIIHLAADGTAWFIDPPNEISIAIDSTKDWQTTGKILHRGDTVTIQVVGGKWTISRKNFPTDVQVTLPDDIRGLEIYINNSCENSGESCNSGRCVDLGLYECPIPTAQIGLLVGRINNGEPFPVGNSITFITSEDGELYLRVNDGKQQGADYLNDNFGVLAVEVSVK